MKKGTIFCDVDGTLVSHDDLKGSHPQKWLPGAKEQLLQWSREYAIVLTTSRTNVESLDAFLFKEGFSPRDVIIVESLPRGPRFLINDRSPDGQDKAHAINVDRNEGLAGVVLE